MYIYVHVSETSRQVEAGCEVSTTVITLSARPLSASCNRICTIRSIVAGAQASRFCSLPDSKQAPSRCRSHIYAAKHASLAANHPPDVYAILLADKPAEMSSAQAAFRRHAN